MPSSTVALRSAPLGQNSLSKQLGIHSKGCETASCLFLAAPEFAQSGQIAMVSQCHQRSAFLSSVAFHLSYPSDLG